MKVSIVTVVYNGAEFISSCIDSVLAQDHQDLEYIVIDGGSKDGTQEIVESYGDKISKFISEPDEGIYDAMNKGIRNATGDVIGILNADDFYRTDDVVSIVATTFADSQVELVYGDLVYVKPDNLEKVVRFYSGKSFRPSRLKVGDMPPHPTMFVRREVYEQHGLYKTDYRICADFDMVARLLGRAGVKCKYIPKVMVVMRTGGVSTSGFSSRVEVNREILRACRENGIPTSSARIWSKYFRKIFQLVERPTEA